MLGGRKAHAEARPHRLDHHVRRVAGAERLGGAQDIDALAAYMAQFKAPKAAYDPAADRARGEADFYGHADHRAWIWLRPYAPPADALPLAEPQPSTSKPCG